MFGVRVSKFFVFTILVCLPLGSLTAGLFKKKPEIVYGIDKKVFNALSEEQQKVFVELYNSHEQLKEEFKNKEDLFTKKIKDLEKETQRITAMENERQKIIGHSEKLQGALDKRSKELDDILELAQGILNASSKGKKYAPVEKREKFFPKIISINRSFSSPLVVLDNDTAIEVSPLDKEKVDLWMKGQAIELAKGEGLMYSIQVNNLDAGNTAAAKVKN